MGLIKIFFGDIELDYKKETLSLKKENNALSTDFTATYSSFPFLIVENEKSLKALGSGDITSINKKKIIPVTVISFGLKFYGELQQLSVINGYRKCNLKYSSDILKTIGTKISKYMPVVSVIPGETNPAAFNSENNTVSAADTNWQTYPVPFIGKYFPEVKWQFPTMNYKNKYGNNLDAADVWFKYEGQINRFVLNTNGTYTFKINTAILNATNKVDVSNFNVPSPQIFILSPLHYFAQTVGYKYKGSFVDNEFIKRLLFYSSNDNIIPSYYQIQGLTNFTLAPLVSYGPPNHIYVTPSIGRFTTTKAGRHTFKFKFTEPLFTKNTTTNTSFDDQRFTVYHKDVLYWRYRHEAGTPLTIYEAEVSIDISDADVGSTINLQYQGLLNTYPTYEIKYSIDTLDTSYKRMHPTIETGRYVPEWTVGNYLNYLKNQFNLDIEIDDFKKEISLNLNETNQYSEVPVLIDKSLALKSYDLAANSSFIIKYANSEDTALYITSGEEEVYTTQGDDFTQKIQSEFKLVPHNGVTSELSEAVVDKDGVGLLIYDAPNAPNTSASYNGLNLNINGNGGIYQTYWKSWIKFLLNASNCQITGYFTDIEIARIYTAKSVYIDNQRYRIVSIEFSEASNNYRELVMELSSVNY